MKPDNIQFLNIQLHNGQDSKSLNDVWLLHACLEAYYILSSLSLRRIVPVYGEQQVRICIHGTRKITLRNRDT